MGQIYNSVESLDLKIDEKSLGVKAQSGLSYILKSCVSINILSEGNLMLSLSVHWHARRVLI